MKRDFSLLFFLGFVLCGCSLVFVVVFVWRGCVLVFVGEGIKGFYGFLGLGGRVDFLVFF